MGGGHLATESIAPAGRLFGRESELARLETLVRDGTHRVIAVTGPGGIGKTALVRHFVATLRLDPAATFRIVWSSLRMHPDLREWLADVLVDLSGGAVVVPQTTEGRIDALVRALAERPVALILDNAESVLDPATAAIESVEQYDYLLARLSGAVTTSKVIVTSRVAPSDASWLYAADMRVGEVLKIGELDGDSAGELFRNELELVGGRVGTADPSIPSSGNPLLLQLIARQRAAGGQPGDEAVEGVAFERVLDWHFQRLPEETQHIALQIAAFMDTCLIVEVSQQFGSRVEGTDLRRSLTLLGESLGITVEDEQVTMQQVVLEFLITRLVSVGVREIIGGRPRVLRWVMLYSPHDSVVRRRARTRAILQPISTSVERDAPPGVGSRRSIEDTLETCRRSGWGAHGVNAPGNLANVLFSGAHRWEGLRLSGLALVGVDFRLVELVGCDLTGAEFRACAFRSVHATVLALAWNPTVQRLIGVDSQGQLVAWDAGDPQSSTTWKVNRTWLRGVAFLGQSNYAVVGGDDGELCCWDLTRGSARWSAIDDGLYWIRCLAATEDGKSLATGSEDGWLRYWKSTETGVEVEDKIDLGSGSLRGVDITADGRVGFCGTDDGHLVVHDRDSGTIRRTRIGSSKVRAVRRSPSGRHIAACTDDAGMQVVGRSDHRSHQAPGAASGLRAVAWCFGGSTLVGGGDNGVLYRWDTESHVTVGSAIRAAQPIAIFPDRIVAIEPQGPPLVAVATEGDHLYVVDLSRATAVERSYGFAERLWSVAVDPGGELVAAGGEDRRVRIWRVGGGPPKLLASLEHGGRVWATAFSSDGRTLATASDDNLLRIWRTADWTQKAERSGHRDWILDVITVSTDRGEVLLTTSNDRRIGVWTLEGEHLRWCSHHGERSLRVAAWTPPLAVSTSSDCKIAIFDPVRGVVLDEIVIAGHHAWGLATAPRRKEIATGGDDGTVVVSSWSAETGWSSTVVDRHDDQVLGVEYLCGGRYLVAGSLTGDGVRTYERTNDGWERRIPQHRQLGARSFAELRRPDRFVAAGDSDMITVIDTATLSTVDQFRADRPYSGSLFSDCIGLAEPDREKLKRLGAIF